MSNLMQSIDDRTKLAGTNRLEILLFSLGTDDETGRNELYGINVFKVREVMHVPEITHAPDMPRGVEGVVSLRGAMIPVINLPEFCGIQSNDGTEILMITEYNKHIQGFLVNTVDTIKRLDWEDVKAPPPMIANRTGGLITAVAELDDGRLVMIMDVERILAETASFYSDEEIFEGIEPNSINGNITILFVDDSKIARDQVSSTLDHLGIKHIGANNGAEAWEKLNEIAEQAEAVGKSASDIVQVILTDVEMPEMDGYVLTKKVKQDPRFSGIPVVMHSSLSSEANRALGEGVGADAYVPKFQPVELAATLKEIIEKESA